MFLWIISRCSTDHFYNELDRISPNHRPLHVLNYNKLVSKGFEVSSLMENVGPSLGSNFITGKCGGFACSIV